jgi:hypothetical protein
MIPIFTFAATGHLSVSFLSARLIAKAQIYTGFVVQYASQVSETDVYSTMDGFISLLVRDIHDWGLLVKKIQSPSDHGRNEHG